MSFMTRYLHGKDIEIDELKEEISRLEKMIIQEFLVIVILVIIIIMVI